MYTVGDKIVYPMHGAAIIEGIEVKEILGIKKKYYVLTSSCKKVKLLIEIDKCQECGIRYIIDENKVDEILEILRTGPDKITNNWNKRYKENLSKLKSGDILTIAEVIRNLHSIEQLKHLSSGDKKMMLDAQELLISELVLVKNISEQEARDIVSREMDKGC